MASYLWLRGQTWFFQLRPPKDLQLALGSTPFRVRLPVQSNRVASRYAGHLAGWAERWFLAMRYRGLTRLRITDAPADFIKSQLRGIVGLRMPISRLDAKRKMSQNRSEADRPGVASGLAASDWESDRRVATMIPH